jgi:hypothetical protein
MALARKINQTTFDGLHEEIQKLYEKNGDEYNLTGIEKEDTGALTRALDRERLEKKQATDDAKAAKDELEALKKNTPESTPKDKDIARLEKLWENRVTEAQTKGAEALAKKDAFIKKSALQTSAMSIAQAIAVKPSAIEVLMPHIERRLTVEIGDDGPKIRVLGKDGEVSANSLTDLEKEFVDNDAFSALIIGSRATGGAGRKAPVSVTQTDFNKMTVGEKQKYLFDNPESAKQLAADATAAGRVF